LAGHWAISIRRCLHGGRQLQDRASGVVTGRVCRNSETIPVGPNSIAQAATYAAVAPNELQEYNSTEPKSGMKELAIRLFWKKGKLHLITTCHLDALKLFMFLTKDPLQGNV